MFNDLHARNKAAESLGIEIDGRRHWLSDGWPQTIPVSTLAKWQFPDDRAAQDALIQAVKLAAEAGELKKR